MGRRTLPGLRTLWVIALAFMVAGCATYTASRLESQFGAPEPRDRVVASVPAGVPDYWTEVKPVLESRCVVCHACYDAPCQLKLDSVEGIERGASTARVYHSSRLTAATPGRLFEDAQTVPAWREKGFFPVLSEYANTPEAIRQTDIVHRLLSLKAREPLPADDQLGAEFDLSLNRKQSCTSAATVDAFERKNPRWGMPYAFPGLAAEEQSVLLKWLEAGSPYTARPPLEPALLDRIDTWEAFLNGDSLKERLMSRYVYEHLFLGHLYFPDTSQEVFFRLIRSRTPPGTAPDIIPTRRPYDDPGIDRVYYRLVPELGSAVAKTHMPYALDGARMTRWQQWFLDADYTVDAMPGYAIRDASNPFRIFDAIPVNSRYRFLLEEAQYTIMSFIKGPVCRGQVALNVINDHFWVFFYDPDDLRDDRLEDFISRQAVNLELPASNEDVFRPIHHWKRYAAQEKKLMDEADRYLIDTITDPGEINLNVVWDGDGTNDNAALTVFRHFDSASVEKGLIGAPPKTAWLIGYVLLERIHYLLVAGYDVYGNLGHQLLSRVYMDFLRMEGETGFLMLLPQSARDRERRYWYREADESVMEFLTLPRYESRMDSSIEYRSADEKLELYTMLQQHLEPVLPDKWSLDRIDDPNLRQALRQLDNLNSPAVTLFPEVSFVEISTGDQRRYVTILRNNAHLNITSLFGEQKLRLPEEDTLTVVPGFIGAYPNMFFRIDRDQLQAFVSRVLAVQDEQDYARLVSDYGVRRTDPTYWRKTDAFQAAYRDWGGVDAGILDFGRVENR